MPSSSVQKFQSRLDELDGPPVGHEECWGLWAALAAARAALRETAAWIDDHPRADAMAADLPVFLRQSHAERDLAELGRRAAYQEEAA